MVQRLKPTELLAFDNEKIQLLQTQYLMSALGLKPLSSQNECDEQLEGESWRFSDEKLSIAMTNAIEQAQKNIKEHRDRQRPQKVDGQPIDSVILNLFKSLEGLELNQSIELWQSSKKNILR